jgi:hypothetical protein
MERGVDDTRPMTGEQAAMLKRLAYVAYELDAFKPSLMRVEADVRIATALARRGRIYSDFLGNSGNLRFTHICGRLSREGIIQRLDRDYGSLPPMKWPWRNARNRDKQ